MKFLFLVLISLYSHAMEIEQLRPDLYGSKEGITCPIHLLPGESFGTIKLGMKHKEVAKLRMVQKNLKGNPRHQIVGMFTVQYSEAGEVIDIGAELGDLPHCVFLGKTQLKPTQSSKELAKLFPGCKTEEVRKGGNTIECPHIWIQTGGWGGAQKTPSIRTHKISYGKTKL